MYKLNINKKTIAWAILILLFLVYRWHIYRVVEKEVVMGDQIIQLNVHLYTNMAYETLEDGIELRYLIKNGRVRNKEIRKDNIRTSITYRYDESENTWEKSTIIYKDNRIHTILSRETGAIP